MQLRQARNGWIWVHRDDVVNDSIGESRERKRCGLGPFRLSLSMWLVSRTADLHMIGGTAYSYGL